MKMLLLIKFVLQHLKRSTSTAQLNYYFFVLREYIIGLSTLYAIDMHACVNARSIHQFVWV